ncbi:MAG: 1-acyl-sn-glycerol-3-phosphate acyltransferase [Rhizobiales bacterium]|nr:1-acyl-sn-glycerol-3-phosphate acyltransferase [Hyphomicrobiales bacterium]
MRAASILVRVAILTLPLMPVQKLLVALGSPHARTFPHWYHRRVARILGLKVRCIGERPRQPCLIAANHVSWLDIPVLSATLPVSFIAKKEVSGWGIFGSLARLQRSVFVDRERRHRTGSSRDEIQERLKAGDTLVLFAEGTSTDGHRVLPFRSAFFASAETDGLIVQPVTIAYDGHWGLPMTRRRRPFYAWYGAMELPGHLWEALVTGPIEVTVIFHPPMSVAGEGGRKALARKAEEVVRKGLMAALSGRAGEAGSHAAPNRLDQGQK